MEERIMILKMLQEGRISVEEASKLLDAIEKDENKSKASYSSKVNDLKEELASKLKELNIEEKLSNFSNKAAKLAESLGEKAGRIAEQFSEKLESERVNEEFSRRIESLGHDIAESAAKFEDMFTYQLENIFDIGFEKYTGSYRYPASSSAHIKLKASNFTLNVLPSKEDAINVDITAKSNIPGFTLDNYFRTVIDGDNFDLNCELPGKSWGKIELYVPKNLQSLIIATENGKCEIGGISAKIINCSTNNGKVYLDNCSGDSIELLTDNGRVIVDNTTAREAAIRTSNAKIDIADCCLDNINAKTTNGNIEAVGLRNSSETGCRYILNTTNGKINLLLISNETCEYMVDASTTMENIDINLPKLTYTLDKKDIGMHSSASVKSDDYETSSNKIYIKADTTNAAINIGYIK